MYSFLFFLSFFPGVSDSFCFLLVAFLTVSLLMSAVSLAQLNPKTLFEFYHHRHNVLTDFDQSQQFCIERPAFLFIRFPIFYFKSPGHLHLYTSPFSTSHRNFGAGLKLYFFRQIPEKHIHFSMSVFSCPFLVKYYWALVVRIVFMALWRGLGLCKERKTSKE